MHGAADEELLDKGYEWLPYIELIGPMLSAKGEWNHFPFRGTWLEQPSKTIQIFEDIRMEFIRAQNEKMDQYTKRK